MNHCESRSREAEDFIIRACRFSLFTSAAVCLIILFYKTFVRPHYVKKIVRRNLYRQLAFRHYEKESGVCNCAGCRSWGNS